MRTKGRASWPERRAANEWHLAAPPTFEPRMMRVLPPRRFRPAFVVACLLSLASVGLAIGPGPRGPYDRELAVLTATLLGIIWYTYFSYRALHRAPETVLLTDLRSHLDGSGVTLTPVLENRSPRTVVARIRLQVWVDGEEIASRAYFDGGELAPLQPFQSVEEHFRPTQDQLKVTRSATGEYWSCWTRLQVVMSVAWRDDLQEAGVLDLQYWHATGPSKTLVRVSDSEGRAQLFGDVADRIRPLRSV